ncbi:MAG: MCE family protein [Chlorobi bacterium]|nr:MCE family protein [Chlorobiota bacterium]
MKIRTEIKAAVFGILALVLFVWGFNFLKGKDILKNYHTFYSVFDNVEGIDNSTPVKLKGLTIGGIKEMTFRPEDRKIVMALHIDRNYFIPKDSKVKITGSGLLGSKNLEIELGFSPEPARDGDTLQSATAAGLTEIIGNSQQQFEELVYNTNQLMIKLNQTFDDANRRHLAASLKNIHALTADLQKSVQQLNAMLAENRVPLRNSVRQLEQTGKNLREITDKLSRADYEELMRNLTESSRHLQALLLDLQQGKGSLGKLAKDEALYRNLNRTLESLNALLEDLKARPERYVQFSVFGKKEKKKK